jgi:ABC-type transport system involved in multi-copper enzyme maturation permease subunit
VRDKILYVLLIFGVLMIVVSRAVGYASFGGELKIMTDIGLASVWIFSGMVSIFVGTGLIYKEIDKRTIYTIISKPAERWQFIVGKYCGLLLTTLVNIGLLSGAFLCYMKLCGAEITAAILQSLFLTFIEMMIVTAIAILFSSASTPILSAIFTTIIFFAGQMTKWIVDMGEGEVKRQAPYVSKLLYGLYLLLPNLHNFNIRKEAVAALEPISAGEIFSSTIYGISYAVAVLLLAHLLFNRRNL